MKVCRRLKRQATNAETDESTEPDKLMGLNQSQSYSFLRENKEASNDRCDIKILNRHYLLLTRDLCRHDPERAHQIVGIPSRYQTLFSNLTYTQIEEIVCSTSLLFALRFKNTKFWEAAVTPDNAQITNVLVVALSLGQQAAEC